MGTIREDFLEELLPSVSFEGCRRGENMCKGKGLSMNGHMSLKEITQGMISRWLRSLGTTSKTTMSFQVITTFLSHYDAIFLLKILK